jgi:2-dehydropantoate 2-reductase
MSKAVLSLRRLLTSNGVHRPKSYNASVSSRRNHTATQDPGRIHVLGLGNIGRLYAHALVTGPSPAPVTLLFHREELSYEWHKAGSSIEIDGISKFLPDILNSSSGYDIEIIDRRETTPKIKNLIIATKAHDTVHALESIAGRLTPETTMLLAQNGLGVTEDVVTGVLRQLGPAYIEGFKASCLGAITSHGLYPTGSFRSVLAGYGEVVVGHHYAEGDPAKSKYLLEAITNAPLLNARAPPWEEFMTAGFQKLVINSTINPLSAIFQRKNGDLFNHKPIYELMRILVGEMSMVFEQMMGFKKELSSENLEQLVLSVAEKTAENTSSMLQDFQAGRRTEIEYLNRWFLAHAKHGLDVNCNLILRHLIVFQERLREDQIYEEFGLEWWQDPNEESPRLRRRNPYEKKPRSAKEKEKGYEAGVLE